MSNILNIKNLDGDWDSIVAIRGKQGEPGADGTQFEVNARFVPGNNVVPIADFVTDKGTPKEVTHTIYAPKGEGGGTTVEYTDLHTFTDTMTVGEISVDGEQSEIVIPANVSEFANDAGYISESKAKRAKILDVENGEVHNARTSIDGWASKILLVFNTNFSGDYIDIYKDEGESHPVARMPLIYGDGTKASFRAGEFCEVTISDAFSNDYYTDAFVVLSRSYSKLSQFEDDKQYINFPKFLASMYDLGRETFAREYNVGDSYEVGDYVSNVETTSGSTYCAIYKCISPISSGTFISIDNTDYWKRVLITDELKNSGGSTEKYMPGDVLLLGDVLMHCAQNSTAGYYILDKPIDESVTGITLSKMVTTSDFTIRCGGTSKIVSPSDISVTINEDENTAHPRRRLTFGYTTYIVKQSPAVLCNVKLTFS